MRVKDIGIVCIIFISFYISFHFIFHFFKHCYCYVVVLLSHKKRTEDELWMKNMDYIETSAALVTVAAATIAHIERRRRRWIKENRNREKKKNVNQKKNGIVECKEIFNFNRLIRWELLILLDLTGCCWIS